MDNRKQKSLLADINSSKLRLPNIRRFEIRYISDRNRELNSFLIKWVPSKLDLLLVNYFHNTQKGIKIGFYINSISKAIRSVSKEIYLTCFEIKEYELEQIVKFASNWERLILCYCDIHCSKKLDFSVSGKCKTKFLSFTECGDTDSKNRKADWISTPSSFKNIVEAISKSRLRDSLQQVDINFNQTLNRDEVQAIFKELGMPHISVALRCTLPTK